MKKSHAWFEPVAFVDCPHCGETHEIGTGIVFSGKYKDTCTKCLKPFLVLPPGEDE